MNAPLPLFLSIPHAGLRIPPEVAPLCLLTPRQIEVDGDEGAAEIYSFTNQVRGHLSTEIARVAVDLNRDEADRRPDGVVKQTTIWNEPVYSQPLSETLIEQLLDRYYRPYHRQLREAINRSHLLAIDCHTMAEFGPPLSPDPGTRRPMICLGDDHGRTCPAGWMKILYSSFEQQFPNSVQINQPFAGGFITRNHGRHHPWVQLEVSRSQDLTNVEKKQRIVRALESFCDQVT